MQLFNRYNHLQEVVHQERLAMEEYISSVSPKGQITIPIEIRKRLGVKPKDKVAFRMEGDEVTITPVTSRLAASFQSVPALKPPRNWKEIEEIAREEHAQEVAREGL
jgi:AbrB family looped-hinge helix DNA binding protein